MLWNARSLKNYNKFLQFKSLVNQYRQGFDILIICESWFNVCSTKFDCYSIKGYNHEKIIRENRKGGGISAYFKNDINYKLISSWNGNFQRLTFHIQLNGSWLKLVAYYRPPEKSNLNEFLEDLENELDDAMPTLIAGDININVLKESNEADEYKAILECSGTQVANNEVTRPATGTNIDHIIIKSNIVVSEIATIENCNSDHNMLVTKIPKTKKESKPYQLITKKIINYEIARKNLKIDEEVLKNFKKEIKTISGVTIKETDVNEQIAYVSEQVKQAIDGATLKKTFKFSNHIHIAPYANWKMLEMLKWMENVNQKIRKRRNKNLPTDKLSKRLEKCKNKLRITTDKAITEYYEDFLGKNDVRAVWKHVNELIGKKPNGSRIKLTENGNLVNDDEKIANIFTSHFKEVSNSLEAPAEVTNNFNQFNTMKRVEETIMLFPTDEFEIARVISNLDSNKACGLDGISVSAVKELGLKLLTPMSIIINEMFKIGTYPDSLKKASVTPVYKNSGDKFDKENYRPISVLSIFNKICEIILLERLDSFFTRHNVKDSHQFAFRKKSGTDLAITELFHHINSALDKNEAIGVIFLDVQKAYDSINHNVLLNKMEILGIRGVAQNLLTSYFSGRKQAVKIGKFLGELETVNKGIGQGSNIGPLIFNIKLNDFQNLPLKCQSIRYADDIAIFFAIPH